MKAFINGRNLFGTPFYPIPGTEVVCILRFQSVRFPEETVWTVSNVICCRTTFLTRRCWQMVSWHLMTGAAGSAGRLDITWRIVQRDAGCQSFVHGTISFTVVNSKKILRAEHNLGKMPVRHWTCIKLCKSDNVSLYSKTQEEADAFYLG